LNKITHIFAQSALNLEDAVSRGLRARRMTVIELAEHLEISRTHFYNVLNGKVPLRDDWAVKLDELFGGGKEEWLAFSQTREIENKSHLNQSNSSVLSKEEIRDRWKQIKFKNYREECHSKYEYSPLIGPENIIGNTKAGNSILPNQKVLCTLSEVFTIPNDVYCIVSAHGDLAELHLCAIGLNHIAPGHSGKCLFHLENLRNKPIHIQNEFHPFKIVFLRNVVR